MGAARPPYTPLKGTATGFVSVNGLIVKLAIIASAGWLFCSGPILAQIPPPQKRAEHVEITKEPALEIAHDDLAIIRWTSTNPGGDDDHLAVIHYGTDPKNLNQTAKSHIRLNRGHAETIFRVRMLDLKPDTTYYYKVTSMGAGGQSDGVESSVNHFTTAAPGQVTSALPQPN
jgi:Purple acid Phosphatase, N-terminal domain